MATGIAQINCKDLFPLRSFKKNDILRLIKRKIIQTRKIERIGNNLDIVFALNIIRNIYFSCAIFARR